MNNIGIAWRTSALQGLDREARRAMLHVARQAGYDFAIWDSAATEGDDAATLLVEAGLKLVGGWERWHELTANFDGRVAFWRRLGVPDVSVDSLAGARDEASWERYLAAFCAFAERFAQSGMRLACRDLSLAREKANDGRRTRLEALMEATASFDACVELNTADLAGLSLCPAEWIRKFAGRCPILNVQDVAAGSGDVPVFAPLWQGTLDWEAIFDASEEAGVEWFVFSPEHSRVPADEAFRRSHAFLAANA